MRKDGMEARLVSPAGQRLREDAEAWRIADLEDLGMFPDRECEIDNDLLAPAEAVWRWYRERFPDADLLTYPWMEFRKAIDNASGRAL